MIDYMSLNGKTIEAKLKSDKCTYGFVLVFMRELVKEYKTGHVLSVIRESNPDRTNKYNISIIFPDTGYEYPLNYGEDDLIFKGFERKNTKPDWL